MDKYQSYKPSGVEWIGEIPELWKLSKNKFLFFSGMGETILKEDLVDGGKTPVYSATQEDTIFGFVNNTNLILNRGDIVIPARGNSIGYVMIVDKESTSTQTTIYLKKKSNSFSSKFVFYFFKGFKENLFQFDNTAIPQITVGQIKENPVILPPFHEQHQIVQFLDFKTELIDRLISTKELKITLLKEQRTSLINQVVTKGLNPNVKMKDSSVEWIGEIPEHWGVFKMKYGVKHINEKGLTTKDDVKISPENVESMTGVCFNYYSDYEGEGIKFRSGDILLNKLRLYLKKIVFTDVDGYSMGEMIVLRCFENLFNRYFYFLIFHQGLIDLLDSQSNGVKLPRVSPEIIMNSLIPYPPIKEQFDIVEYLDFKTKEIDDLVQLEQKKINLLKEYRQSLISEVVTGKIKVTTDE